MNRVRAALHFTHCIFFWGGDLYFTVCVACHATFGIQERDLGNSVYKTGQIIITIPKIKVKINLNLGFKPRFQSKRRFQAHQVTWG